MDHDFEISKALGLFLDSGSSATFACGGSIPLKDDDGTDEKHHTSLEAVTLRWDGPDGGLRIDFPKRSDLADADADVNACVPIETLVRDCQPASFGKGVETVLDPEFRSAVAMDESKFSTNFDPYRLGIVEQLQRVLLPNVDGVDLAGVTQSVSAELYKLNIYQAPSGFLKSHVDTPRDKTQFGSLVVCLPWAHKGGQLVVRHAGKEVNFDWGGTTANSDASTVGGNRIHWAAFYSDCEHEIFNVTEGHRVTLTYNLYAVNHSPSTGGLVGVDNRREIAPVDVKSLPLYKVMLEALGDEECMKKGGMLGIFCAHRYPMNSTPKVQLVSREFKISGDKSNYRMSFKGTDLALMSVLNTLGTSNTDITVRSVLGEPKVLWSGGQRKEGWWKEKFKDDGNGGSYGSGNDDGHESDESYENDENVRPRIGLRPGQTTVTDCGGNEQGYTEIFDQFGDRLDDITWLNQPKHDDASYIHLTYGNNAGVDFQYTSAAIFVRIKRAEDEKK